MWVNYILILNCFVTCVLSWLVKAVELFEFCTDIICILFVLDKFTPPQQDSKSEKPVKEKSSRSASK